MVFVLTLATSAISVRVTCSSLAIILIINNSKESTHSVPRETSRATLTSEGAEGAASSPSKSDGCGVKNDACMVSNVGTDAILGRLRILEQPECHLSQRITINQAITPNTQSQVTLKNIGPGFLHFTQPSEFQPLTRLLYSQVVPVSFAPMLICS